MIVLREILYANLLAPGDGVIFLFIGKRLTFDKVQEGLVSWETSDFLGWEEPVRRLASSLQYLEGVS